jgi:hypothetical protein
MNEIVNEEERKGEHRDADLAVANDGGRRERKNTKE